MVSGTLPTASLASNIDTSSELAAILGDETGSNLAVFNTAPTIHAPYVRGAGTGAATFALRIADSTPTDRMVVLDNGNVGIGLTNPSYKLHVSGTAAAQVLATLNYALPANTGATGKILKLANGVLDWADDSTGTDGFSAYDNLTINTNASNQLQIKGGTLPLVALGVVPLDNAAHISGTIVQANLGIIPDANVANDITLTNITQITNRSIADLSGTLPLVALGVVPLDDTTHTSGTIASSRLGFLPV
jgi:hypothetical protein